MPNTITVEWQGLTFEFQDTAWCDAVYVRMIAKFAPEGAPDRGLLADACWIMAHTVKVDGAKGWKIATHAATPEQFEASCMGLLNLGTRKDIEVLATAINELKAPVAGPLDKPDEDLTPEEAADPN